MPYIKRTYEVVSDPDKCFIEQGLICMGPATRSGCGTMCINANMPCTGCMGPTPEVEDQGARMMSAIATFLKTDVGEFEVEGMIRKIKDPVGTFYMYSLAKSILGELKWRK
jgi:F420-non-reducing hydrogenase small subunit